MELDWITKINRPEVSVPNKDTDIKIDAEGWGEEDDNLDDLLSQDYNSP